MSNTRAHLKMRPDNDTQECWDRLSLTITGNNTVIPFIVFKDRKSANKLFYDLSIAYSEDGGEGSVDVDIDGTTYTFDADARQVIESVLADWLSDFVASDNIQE